MKNERWSELKLKAFYQEDSGQDEKRDRKRKLQERRELFYPVKKAGALPGGP